MHIKSDFLLRKVASSYMAVPVGSRTSEMSGIIALNETAAFLWDVFRKDTTIEEATNALLSEFDTDEATARAAVERIVEQFRSEGLLEE